jgi:CrcB protein
MMIWLLVGVGGALGSVARYGLNRFVHQLPSAGTFPLGIFLINVLGSAAIGLLGGLTISGRLAAGLEARTFLIVGVLGGFTTFSSFSLDTLALVRAGQVGHAAWNVVGQVGLSLLAVWLGFTLGAKP